MTDNSSDPGFTWLFFALGTVSMWGLYGFFLHKGQGLMADPENGRYKAFLFVGLAYFLTAVLAPLVLLLVRGSDWNLPAGGVKWSLIAGTVGSIGAFFVLLAFGAKGTPPVVMSIIFAGAPILNAIVSISAHPPEGGIKAISPLFFLGIVIAAIGAGMVLLNKPKPGPAHGPAHGVKAGDPGHDSKGDKPAKEGEGDKPTKDGDKPTKSDESDKPDEGQ